MDDRLSAPSPGAERVVADAAHGRSCSGSSSPLSRWSRRASPRPFWRLSVDRSPPAVSSADRRFGYVCFTPFSSLLSPSPYINTLSSSFFFFFIFFFFFSFFFFF